MLPLLFTVHPSKTSRDKVSQLTSSLKALEASCQAAATKVWHAERLQGLAKLDVVAAVKRPQVAKARWEVAVI